MLTWRLNHLICIIGTYQKILIPIRRKSSHLFRCNRFSPKIADLIEKNLRRNYSAGGGQNGVFKPLPIILPDYAVI
jgi:hypothetical protein